MIKFAVAYLLILDSSDDFFPLIQNTILSLRFRLRD